MPRNPLEQQANKPLYAELRQIEEAARDRDLTGEEFERTCEVQDEIYDNDIANELGEMHPYHTGTIGEAQFAKLDKNNL